MLTGELPGQQLTAPSSKVKIEVRLDEIVLRALENQPELRYQQASVLKEQIVTYASETQSKDIAGGKPGEVQSEFVSPSSIPVPGAFGSRRFIRWMMILAFMASMLALVHGPFVGFLSREAIGLPIMGPAISEAEVSGPYLRSALLVLVLSVWMLVGLFYYLNRYTKRNYFAVWTAAWSFYAVWLTLELEFPQNSPETIVFKIQQCCVAVSSVLLLWGSLLFLRIPVRQRLFGLFMLFLVAWTFASQYFISVFINASGRKLETQMPVFILIGLSNVFAAGCFFWLRKTTPFVGAGMLSTGFFLWGPYLASYPLYQQSPLHSAGFFLAGVLQFFIAVSMIVLVLQESQQLPKAPHRAT
jgi:hypothetical protein